MPFRLFHDHDHDRDPLDDPMNVFHCLWFLLVSGLMVLPRPDVAGRGLSPVAGLSFLWRLTHASKHDASNYEL
jgi:hypothetical protein